MKNCYALLLLLCALVFTSFKGDHEDRARLKAIEKIKQEGFTNSKVMETLFQLTDVTGPRLTGSTGMKKAEQWARRQLEDWGLENAAIEPWGGFGKGWETHKSYVAMSAPYYQQLIAVPKAWTPGTNGLIKAQAVLIRVDSPQDMEKYKGKLRGKIVVYATTNAYELRVNFNADAKRLTDEELQKNTYDTHLDDAGANPNPYIKAPAGRRVNTLRPKLDSFLMDEGALAVLSGGRGIDGTVFTSNGASRAWNAKPVLPEMEMGAEHMDRLIRLLDAGKEVSLEMDMDNTFLTADSIENNVVAEIPGTDLKDEVVLLGAHMDSWHAATGATDNGTGSAVVMEAIRILKATGLKPRRTIRVILWSGEEQGLLGSRAYVKKHYGDKDTRKFKAAYEKVSAYYNLDNGGARSVASLCKAMMK